MNTFTTKYKIGDTVYRLDTDSLAVIKSDIMEIVVRPTGIYYVLEGKYTPVSEAICFTSPQELLDHIKSSIS